MMKYIKSSIDPIDAIIDADPETLAQQFIEWLSDEELEAFCREYGYIDDDDDEYDDEY